jgi:hypothetical protein
MRSPLRPVQEKLGTFSWKSLESTATEDRLASKCHRQGARVLLPVSRFGELARLESRRFLSFCQCQNTKL